MDQPSLSDTLNELARSKSTRSETARLRDVYAEVEHALTRGVSRKAVLEALHADGFTMSLKMFDKALYRIRRSMKNNSTKAIATPKKTSTTTAPKETQFETREKTIHNPSDLRKHREEFMKNTDWYALSKPVSKKS